MIHGPQISVRPDFIILQGKSCFLWPESRNANHHNITVSVGGLSGFQGIQEDHAFPIPKDSEHHFAH